MASINSVARHVLGHYRSLTTMKLQKLVFYSQAHSLVQTGRPLFENDFEAWRGGPVSPTLFQLHRGKFLVSLEEIPQDGTSLNGDEKQLVDEICQELGQESGKALSERTHREDPWLNAREGLDPAARSHTVITKASIAKYYSDHPII